MSYDRPFKCMPSPCKCCCYQEMTFYDESGTNAIGMIKEDCFKCAREARPTPPWGDRPRVGPRESRLIEAGRGRVDKI